MTQFIRATREVQMDTAHRVPYHGSKCRHLHGHRYRIIMEIMAEQLGAKGSPEDGMVMDFGFMKRLLEQHVTDPCDHATILFAEDPLYRQLRTLDEYELWKDADVWDARDLGGVLTSVGRVICVPFIPTAENLAQHWATILNTAVREETQGRAWVYSVTVWETPNCSAVAHPPSPAHLGGVLPEAYDGDEF